MSLGGTLTFLLTDGFGIFGLNHNFAKFVLEIKP